MSYSEIMQSNINSKEDDVLCCTKFNLCVQKCEHVWLHKCVQMHVVGVLVEPRGQPQVSFCRCCLVTFVMDRFSHLAWNVLIILGQPVSSACPCIPGPGTTNTPNSQFCNMDSDDHIQALVLLWQVLCQPSHLLSPKIFL